jgi:GT2 family glycosyltransferase
MVESAAMRNNAPLVTIIFVYFNNPLEIASALASVNSAVGSFTYEVIIVNNSSFESLPKYIRNLEKVTVINNGKNNGYGKALNQGAEIAKGKYLLLSNSDLVFLENSISLMVKKLEQDLSVGIIGPQFLDIKHKIQKVGSDMPFLPGALFAFSFLNKFFKRNHFSKQYFLLDFDRKTEREIPALCGACFMIRKSVFRKINGFDERFFMYFEEADICFRVKKANFKVLYYPAAKVIHLIGKSSNDKNWIRKNFEKSRYRFFRKYHNVFIATFGEGLLRLFAFLGRVI